MSKIYWIYILFLIFVCLTNSNPIHDIQLDKTFIHEFTDSLLGNLTEFLGSNSYTDIVGNWHWDSQKDIMKCQNGIATKMWLISLPYIKMGTQELNWPDHRAIQLNVDCGDRILPYTVDFSQSKGARRRFGYFDHDKIILRGPIDIYLPVRKLHDSTESRFKYNLLQYNCHHFADEMFEKLKVIGGAIDKRQKKFYIDLQSYYLP